MIETIKDSDMNMFVDTFLLLDDRFFCFKFR